MAPINQSSSGFAHNMEATNKDRGDFKRATAAANHNSPGIASTVTSQYILQATGLFLLLILLPLLILIALVATVYDTFLSLLIRNKLGNHKFWIVSPTDTLFLQEDPDDRADTMINLLMQFRGRANLDHYRQIIQARMIQPHQHLQPPKLTCYTTKFMHRQLWVPERDFDVRDHVYIHETPCPRDDAGVRTLLGEICSTSLPVDRSPWQLIILSPSGQEPDEDQSHYALMRVHHSISDGMSLMRLILTRIVDEPPVIDPSKRGGTPRPGSLARKLLGLLLQGPATILTRLASRTDHNLIHGPPLTGQKLMAYSQPVNLDRLKAIKNATKTTVNDVFLSCLSSAVRAHIHQQGAEIPADIQTYLPVDMRTPSSLVTLDNNFSTVFLDLPLSHQDPLLMLSAIQRRTLLLKSSPEPLVSALTMSYYLHYLPTWLTKAVCYDTCSKCTLVSSNMPGPTQQLHLANNAMTTVIFWALPKANIGVTASMFSYRDEVRVGVMADRAVMTDPEVLARGFVAQVRALEQAIKMQSDGISRDSNGMSRDLNGMSRDLNDMPRDLNGI